MATEGGGIYVAVKQDKVEIKGDVEVQGKVKVRDDVIAKTISLVNHKHTDSRNGNTSAPAPEEEEWQTLLFWHWILKQEICALMPMGC